MTTFEADIPAVVGGLLDAAYPELGPGKLTDVLSFSTDNHAAATTVANLALVSHAVVEGDVRILVAGAQIAFFRDPEAYRGRGVHARILKRIGAVRATGPRGPASQAPEEKADEWAGFAVVDPAEGARIYGVIERACATTSTSTQRNRSFAAAKRGFHRRICTARCCGPVVGPGE